MNYTRKIIIALISLTLSACVFQPSVQQGNFIEQDKVEQIEIAFTVFFCKPDSVSCAITQKEKLVTVLFIISYDLLK